MHRSVLYRFLVVTTAAVGAMGLATCGSRDSDSSRSAKEPAAVTQPPAPAASTAATTGGWTQLEPLVGKYPRESNLFDNSAITPQLKAILGDKFDTFKTNMQVQSPLTKDGNVLFTTGNKPHEGGTDMAYLIIDPATEALEVGLWQAGILKVYATRGTALPKPEDIQTMISNSES